MLSTFHAGELLKSLVMLQQGKRGIEGGTFTCFSALCRAEALPADGKLITLDIKSEYVEVAKTFWEKAGVNDKIESVIGDATETLNQMASDPKNIEAFDFAFLDADKKYYPEYYEAAMKLLKPKGLIIIDNVLRRGMVYADKFIDEKIEAVKKTTLMIQKDPRVEHLNMLPLDDGISIVVKE